MRRRRRAPRDDHDFTPPREYLGVYLDRRRESGFQLYNTLGIARGDKMALCASRRWRTTISSAPRMSPIIHTDEPLGIYGAVDCGAYVSNFMLAAAGARPRHHSAGARWRGTPA